MAELQRARPGRPRPGPRPAPALRRLRSVAPGRGPAATARLRRTRRCESRARTTAPTGPRDAARPEARGGARRAMRTGSCSPRVSANCRSDRLPPEARRLPGPPRPPAPLEMAEPRGPGGAACRVWLRVAKGMLRGQNCDYYSQNSLRGRKGRVFQTAQSLRFRPPFAGRGARLWPVLPAAWTRPRLCPGPPCPRGPQTSVAPCLGLLSPPCLPPSSCPRPSLPFFKASWSTAPVLVGPTWVETRPWHSQRDAVTLLLWASVSSSVKEDEMRYHPRSAQPGARQEDP